MFYVASPIEWIGLGVTLGYLGVVAAIMLYLELSHPRTWELLGRPSMLFRSPTLFRIGDWLPLMVLFVGLGFLFREKWRLPEDPMLPLMLWTGRILFITAVALLPGAVAMH